ncbi:MAG: hypothetical protein QM757_13645 [Paludibaculum sp.]
MGRLVRGIGGDTFNVAVRSFQLAEQLLPVQVFSGCLAKPSEDGVDGALFPQHGIQQVLDPDLLFQQFRRGGPDVLDTAGRPAVRRPAAGE